MSRRRRAALATALIAAAATPRIARAEPAWLPLTYRACPPVPGDPGRITIASSPKGPTVTYERPDLGAPMSRDVNLAFVSRRLFFKLRTETELIEFQGHAGDQNLDGLLSDRAGARRISMRAVPTGADCGGHR